MSWPTQWPSANQSAVPSVLNPATPVINSAPAVVPPGLQYTPDQWAQLQQQNWHQWAQWQQQYQQWHQQYGAEYQKSMNALAQAAQQTIPTLPNVAVPPPLPVEAKPPPPEDPPPYTTAPPPPQPGLLPKPNTFQKTPNWKRNYDQSPDQNTKRQMTSRPNWQNQTTPLPKAKIENTEELSEAERKFDKQFADWEAQFNKWKEQNAEHPDKEQYKEYEKKWETWRAQLLERREQMKRKRLGLAKCSPNDTRPSSSNFTQPPPRVNKSSGGLLPTPPPSFNKPPPTMNDEPLKFKPAKSVLELEEPVEDFIRPDTSGGIPGLDLVKNDDRIGTDKEDEVVVLDAENEKKGPDFDAISKGINSILGDPKLLNMLSLVSQNQNAKIHDNLTNTLSKIKEITTPDQSQMPFDQSNLSYEDHSNHSETFGQREFVNNFDDQTRSSFTMAHNEHFETSQSNNNNNLGRNQQRFDQNQFSNFKNNNNRFSGPDNNKNHFSRNDFGNERQFGGDRFASGPANNEKIYTGPTSDFSSLPTTQRLPPPNRFPSSQDRFIAPNDRDYEMGPQRPFGNFNRGQYDGFEQNYEYEQEREHYEETSIEHNQEEIHKEEPPPEPDILQPSTVIDYEHKSLKNGELEILVEPIHMFDYRHKALNRIPFPQRPKWLSDTVKNIREFDPPLVRPYEPPNLRRYVPSVDAWRKEPPPRPHYEDNWQRNRRYTDTRTPSYKSERILIDNKKDERKPPPEPIHLEEENISDTEWQDLEEEAQVEMKTNTINFSHFSKSECHKSATLIEDLITPPGRFSRPPRIVIILRGPPGSGKTFLAKLIKDKEVENGGSTPRILSLDDYFMVEQEKEVTEDGKRVKVKDMVYEYEAEMEESYRLSLVKSFKKTITDGYFSFIIVDNVNDKVKYFGEMWSFAKQNGFQVYICQLDLDVQLCSRRNIHGRSEADIRKCVENWEPTPSHHPTVDATSLLQSASIPEVEMEEVNSPESDLNDLEGSEDQVARSKWDNFDCSVHNLAKLDGVSKPLRHSRTMEEYLQLETEWTPLKPAKPGQKRVRWADLEERKQQEKMRAIGFVVGQTNWGRMMDPTMGGSALTQTKYIERTGRY